ncbi:MAG: hypothetical protein JKY37_30960 [Nannocystaceae bacterium]|nr:hypothetical protein [Nannocystaceae bacterium]
MNSTISGNSGGQNGGGLLAQSAPGSAFNIQFSNVTLASNDAQATGGIALVGNAVTATLRNSIFHGNTSMSGAGDCGTSNGASVSSGGYNVIGATNGCTLSQQVSDNIGGDPLLEALADNGGPTLTHALPPESPAVDMGNPANCLDAQGVLVALDQRSEDRYGAAGTCDVGAFERLP